MATMRVGGLFSGIGGWELGLERAGMEIAWHVEADEFCRRVLAKHWPDVPCYEDVRTVSGASLAPVDVLCGGFPCQDISVAGKGAGIEGSRSGLWSEYARLIGELRPRYVLVENVSALLSRGLGTVLGDLAALGYDAEWDCLPASALGAPHPRDRFWLVAYPDREGLEGRRGPVEVGGEVAATTSVVSPLRPWANAPRVARVDDGVPDWVDRVKATGNALVPQIAEWIGRRIVAYEESLDAA